MTKLERQYQAKLKNETLPDRFPDAVIIKMDPRDVQGIPDICVFMNGKYAWLEFKRESDSSHRPNQDWYVNKAEREGAFGSFIFPENEKEVLDKLEQYFLQTP